MIKTKNFLNWQTLIASGILFLLVGCTDSTFKATPTALPPYLHYTPSEEFDVHLEFDYPSNWILKDSIPYTDTIVISMGDARFLILPTPENTHPIPTDLGSVIIWIEPNKPSQTPNSQVEMLEQVYRLSGMAVLDNYKIVIDGYDASVLEYQVDDPESYTSLMFARRIYFVVKHQMYEILFIIAEKDRGGEFERGYEIFIDSLKIIR